MTDNQALAIVKQLERIADALEEILSMWGIKFSLA